MKQLFTIYYLPNCTRPEMTNSKGEILKGKVGLTKEFNKRLYFNKQVLKLDTSDYVILFEGFVSKEEALAMEVLYQLRFDCIDGTRNPVIRNNISNAKSGVTISHQTESHKQKTSLRMKQYWDNQRKLKANS